jgi:hypothetical protein
VFAYHVWDSGFNLSVTGRQTDRQTDTQYSHMSVWGKKLYNRQVVQYWGKSNSAMKIMIICFHINMTENCTFPHLILFLYWSLSEDNWQDSCLNKIWGKWLSFSETPPPPHTGAFLLFSSLLINLWEKKKKKETKIWENILMEHRLILKFLPKNITTLLWEIHYSFKTCSLESINKNISPNFHNCQGSTLFFLG